MIYVIFSESIKTKCSPCSKSFPGQTNITSSRNSYYILDQWRQCVMKYTSRCLKINWNVWTLLWKWNHKENKKNMMFRLSMEDLAELLKIRYCLWMIKSHSVQDTLWELEEDTWDLQGLNLIILETLVKYPLRFEDLQSFYLSLGLAIISLKRNPLPDRGDLLAFAQTHANTSAYWIMFTVDTWYATRASSKHTV